MHRDTPNRLTLFCLILTLFAVTVLPAGHAAHAADKKPRQGQKDKNGDKNGDKNKGKANNKKKKKVGFKNWQDYVHPLHVAASEGDLREVQKQVVSKKANVNGKVKDGRPEFIGFTPLHFAAFRAQTRVAAYLLSKDANPNLPDAKGKTPLHWAAQYNQRTIVELLLKHGGQVNAQDKARKKPIDLTTDERIEVILKKAAQASS